MAKQVISRVLETFLGKYISGLTGDALRVDLWSGELHLENLSLKQDALNDFDLPIKIAGGGVRRVDVHVPWNQLGSASVRVSIQGVYLLAVPHADLPTRDELRKEKIDKLEAQEVARQETRRSENNSDDSTFLSRLTRKIMDNLSLTISDIHITYEDVLSNPTQPFSMGVVLSRFDLQTTDEDGNVVFVDRTDQSNFSTFLHKCMSVKKLGVYCTRVQQNSLISYQDGNKVIEILHKGIESDEEKWFLLEPVTVSLMMTKNETSDYSLFPKYSVMAGVDTGSFIFRREQYEDLLLLQKGFTNRRAIIGVFKQQQRPSKSPKKAPFLWWHYAIKSIRPKLFRGVMLSAIKQAKEDRNIYMTIYERFKTDPQHLSEQDLLAKNEFEEQYDNRLILILRDKVEDILQERASRHSAQQRAEGKSASSWYGYFFGSKKESNQAPATTANRESVGSYKSAKGDASEAEEDDDDSDAKSFSSAVDADILTEDGKKNLQDSILELERMEAEDLPEGAIIFSFCADLKLGKLTLKSAGGKDLLSSRFSGAVESQLWKKAWNLSFMLRELSVMNGQANEVTYPTLLSFVQPTPPDSTNETPGAGALSIQFWAHPPNCDDDYRVRVNMPSFRIVMDVPTMRRYTSFFEEPHAQVLWASASQSFSDWYSSREKELASLLAQRKRWDVLVDMDAPLFIIPEKSKALQGSLIFVDLGHFRLSNLHANNKNAPSLSLLANTLSMHGAINSASSNDTSDSEPQPEKSEYDHWKLDMDNIQVLLGRAPDIGRDCEKLAKKDSIQKVSETLVHQFSINLDLQTLMVQNDSLTTVKVAGKLPKLEVSLSDRNIAEVSNTIRAVTQHTGPSKERPPASSLELLAKPPPLGQLDETSTEEANEMAEQNRKDNTKKCFMEASFEVKVFDATLCCWDSAKRLSEGVLHVRLTTMKVTSMHYIHATVSTVYLNQLLIEDLLYDENSPFRVLASSSTQPHKSERGATVSTKALGKDEQPLVFVTSTSYSSPKYANVAMTEVDCKFNTLRMNWNPSSMAILSRLSKKALGDDPSGTAKALFSSHSKQDSIGENMEGVDPKPSSSASVAKTGRPAALRSSSTSSLTSDSKGGSQKLSYLKRKKNLADLQIKATLHKFKVTFNKDFQRRRLASLSVQSVDFAYKSVEDTFTLSGRLDHIVAEDHSINRNVHARFVSSVPDAEDSKSLPAGEEKEGQPPGALLTFNVQTFDPKSTTKPFPGYNNLVDLRLSPTRIVYIHQQILELFDYLMEGVLGVLVSSAVQYAADAVASSEDSHTKLVVEIIKPLFVIPQSSKSKDYVAVSAKELALSHTPQKEVQRCGKKMIADWKEVTVSGLQISSSGDPFEMTAVPAELHVEVEDLGFGFIDSGQWTAKAPSAGPLDDLKSKTLLRTSSGRTIDTSQPVKCRGEEQPRYTIDARLPMLDIKLSKSTYLILRGILSDNFGEKPSLMSELDRSKIGILLESDKPFTEEENLDLFVDADDTENPAPLSPQASFMSTLQPPQPAPITSYRRDVHYGYDDENQPPAAFTLLFSMASTKVEFLNDHKTLFSDCEHVALFEMKNLTLGVFFPTRRSSFLEVEAESIAVSRNAADDDGAQIHPAHRKFIRSDSKFLVNYEWSDDGSSSSTVLMFDTVQLTYLSPAFLGLGEFFSSHDHPSDNSTIVSSTGTASTASSSASAQTPLTDTQELKKVAKIAKKAEPISPRERMEAASNLSAGIVTSDTSLVANQLQLILLDDYTKEAPRALLVSTSIQLSKTSKAAPLSVQDNALISLSQLEVLAKNCSRPGCQGNIQLVEPTKVSVDFDEVTENQNPTRRSFACQIDVIDIILSYQDVLLIKKIASTFSSSSHVAQEAPKSASHDGSSPLSITDGSPQPSQASSPVDADLEAQTSVEAHTTHVSLTFINDCEGCDMPLWQFALERAHVFANGDRSKLSGGAEVSFAARYYEPQIQEWQLLLEKWDVRTAVITQARAQPRMQVIVEADTPGCLNITDGFLKSLASAAGTWKRQSEGTHISKSLVPVILKNDTGLDFHFWIDDLVEDKSFLEKTESREIDFLHKKGRGSGLRRVFAEPGAPSRASMVNKRKDSSGEPTAPRQANQLSIYFGDKYAPILGIQPGVIGGNGYPLMSSEGQILTPLIIDSQLEDGRIVVTACSHVRLINYTPLDVEVLANDPRWPAPVYLGVVRPQERLGVPIEQAAASELRLRPYLGNEKPYDWSAPLLLQAGSKTMKTKVVSTFSPGVECVLRAETKYDEGMTVLSIYPPVAVLNMLPARVQFQISTSVMGGEHGIVSGSLSSGDEGYIMNFHPSSTVVARVLIDGCRWSQPIPLKAEKKPISCRVQRGNDSGMLSMYVKSEESAGGMLRLGLYADVWLVNRTGLPLIYSNGKDEYDGMSSRTTFDNADVCMYQVDKSYGGLLRVKVPGSLWSAQIKPDPTYLNWQNEVVRCVSPNSTTYEFGVSVDYDTEKFGNLTTVINLVPRYLIVNNCSSDLLIKEGNFEGSLTTIASGAKQPFYWASGKWNPLSISLRHHYYGWSEHFKIERAGSFETVIPGDVNRGAVSDKHYVSVSVTFGGLAEASMLVVFSDGGMGIDTNVMSQMNEIVFGNTKKAKGEIAAFDCDRIVELRISGMLVTVSRSSLNKKPGILRKDSTIRSRIAHMRGDGENISGPIARLTVSRIRFSMRSDDTASRQELQVACGVVQLEDLLNGSKFPMVLSPISSRGGPFFQASLVANKFPGIYVVQQLRVHCGDIRLQTSNYFIIELLKLVENMYQHFAAKKHPFSHASDIMSDFHASTDFLTKRWSGGTKTFVDSLVFDPLKLVVSFERLPDEEDSQDGFFLLQNLRIRIDGASLQLPAFQLAKVYGTQESFTDSLSSFYIQQMKGQVFGLLDSIEVSTLVTDSVSNVFSSLVGKTDERLEDGFEYMPLTNKDVVRKHSIAFENCPSREMFNRQLTHLIFDWDSNHTGMGARPCIAIAILNNSREDLVLSASLPDGAELYLIPDRTRLMHLGNTDNNRWRPDRAVVVFGFGYTPSPLSLLGSGKVKIIVRCNGFTAAVDQEKGQVTSRPGYSAAFVDQEATKWWARYVLIVGDDLKDSSQTPAALSSGLGATVIESSTESEYMSGDSVCIGDQSIGQLEEHFDVLFEEETLGMRVEEVAATLLVRGFNRTQRGGLGPAERTGKISVGDRITSVNGIAVSGMNSFYSLIKNSPRPLVLRFARKERQRQSGKEEPQSSPTEDEDLFGSGQRTSSSFTQDQIVAAEQEERRKQEWASLFG